MSEISLVFLGDIVGRPGRQVIKNNLAKLKSDYNYDLLIVNAENAAGGRGITPKVADEIFSLGVDFITLGDHTWDEKEIIPYLDKYPNKIIRPDNFPTEQGGRGWSIIEYKNTKIGIFNLLGRTFMSGNYDCPFKAADSILQEKLKNCKIKLLDFHAETTSEKHALVHHLAGRISLMVGTHTHVPTADARIINSTGYITDLGMTGSYDHVIGLDKTVAINRFIDLPKHYKLGKGGEKISGVFAKIDLNGACKQIELITWS